MTNDRDCVLMAKRGRPKANQSADFMDTQRTVSVTIRVPQKIYSDMKELAKSKHMNFNQLSNLVLFRYMTLTRFVEETHASVITRSFFLKIIEKFEDSEWDEIYKEILQKDCRDLLVANNLPNTLENWLEFVLPALKYTGDYYEFRYAPLSKVSNQLKLDLVHDYGEKWSKILYRGFEGLFSEVFHFKIVKESVVISSLQLSFVVDPR